MKTHQSPVITGEIHCDTLPQSFAQTRHVEVPIYFIPYHKFRKLKELPRFPDNKDLCVNLDDVNFDDSFVVFISHCWLRGRPEDEGYENRPHPDNSSHEKFQLIKEAIPKVWGEYATKMKTCYIWLDFGCINQDANPCAELKQLDLIIYHSDFLLTTVVDKDYNDWDLDATVDGALSDYKAKSWQYYLMRAWCRVEPTAEYAVKSVGVVASHLSMRATTRTRVDGNSR